MRVLITGSNGFIGKNLKARLKEFKDIEIVTFNRQDELSSLSSKLINIDYVFHFASINRSENDNDFIAVNVNLVNLITDKLIEIKENSGKSIPLIFTSSTQVNLDNIYGNTKKNAESILKAMSISFDIPIYIFRLPNVFGKWCKPNYNSVVSTFCHNIANDLPITINDPDAEITLLYIDDLIESFLKIIHTRPLNRDLSRINYTNNKNYLVDLPKTESISIKSLASIIYSFKEMRLNLMVGKVGTGLTRALYSTYISYFNKDSFSYQIPRYSDTRGAFVEILKTPNNGQFSYFTAYPGVTRGGHYHHSKTEKFLVVKGCAVFKFKHIITEESCEIKVTESDLRIVDTIPGWAHDITNTGTDDLIVLIWANELFDKDKPDTYRFNL